MNLENLIHFIKIVDYENFKKDFLSQNLSEIEKQKLLVIIIDEYYDHKKFTFFKVVLDCIIDRRLNLNFFIENHYARNLLSLTISRAPYVELFDYFLANGAKINYYQIPKDNIDEFDELETCLDFANNHISDMIYNLETYSEYKGNYNNVSEDKVCIDKFEYEDLLQQSKHLHDLKRTSELRDFIIASGGKEYKNLK